MTVSERLKCYLRNEFVNRRTELGISQEQMAENLNISLRSYANLENGRYCCSLVTFINYLNNCDVDKERIFIEIAEIFNNCE